ncbi:hypothetical protein ZWY2020_017593 [Hordeum vulgare]|nr:hypothetical protein ZWY2020_017593 [Hordeum vulgare]
MLPLPASTPSSSLENQPDYRSTAFVPARPTGERERDAAVDAARTGGLGSSAGWPGATGGLEFSRRRCGRGSFRPVAPSVCLSVQQGRSNLVAWLKGVYKELQPPLCIQLVGSSFFSAYQEVASVAFLQQCAPLLSSRDLLRVAEIWL